MNEFKFRDLIPKGEGGKIAFEHELRRRVSEWKGGFEYVYKGGADLLLQHGRFWTGEPLRDEYAHLLGQMSQCFVNSYHAAAQSDMQYVEGYYSLGDGFFMPHAWCVTLDGGIQDMTVSDDWIGSPLRSGMTVPTQDHWSYWGVVFHTDLIEDHVDGHDWCLPMLDRPRAEMKLHGSPIGVDRPGEVWDFEMNHDYPILKLVYDPDRREYP